jgi:hypothetical protein
LKVKGTYTIKGDEIDAEVGIQLAPQTYLKLGELKGNPGNGPITIEFKNNPDFYKGDLTVQLRTPEELRASGIQTLGIFNGLLAKYNFRGLGHSFVDAAFDFIEYVPISNFFYGV